MVGLNFNGNTVVAFTKLIYMIKITNLTKQYDKTTTVFDNFNLEIETGKITAIMGKSGKGKSTLLRILALLDKDFEGQILWNNLDVKTFDDGQITNLRANEIGFIFQDFYLVPELTVWENLELVLMIQKKQSFGTKIEKILKFLDIYSQKDKLPSKLSGGQIQRVAIARAIVGRPKVLFADEPTGNLDMENTMEVLKLFRNIQVEYGTTIIVVTHSETVQENCDVIVRL